MSEKHANSRKISLFKALVVLTAFLVGCKFEGGVVGLPGAEEDGGSSKVNDFENSVIQQAGTWWANGITEYNAYVWLINSDGTPVTNFTPAFSASMAGMTPMGCTKSDHMGKAVCKFKSTQDGQFVFDVVNIGKKLEKMLVFSPSTTTTATRGIVPAGAQSQTGPGGWVGQGTFGSTTSATQVSGPGGWSAQVDVQGGILKE